MLSTAGLAFAIETTTSFDFRSKEYAALFAVSGAHAFQHPIWLEAFYRRLAPHRGAQMHVLVARADKGGELHLVMPLILRRKRGFRLLEATDLGVSDYSAPVASPAFWSALDRMPELPDQLLAALPKCDVFRIRPVRAEDCPKFERLFNCQPFPLGFSAHAVRLATPYDDWRKSHINGSLRKMIDRKSRKLKRECDPTITELGEPDAIRAAQLAIATLRDGRFEGDVIQDDFALDFYRDVAVTGAANGFASTWRVRAGDSDIGYLFGLTHAGRFYYLLIGCDYDRFGQYSPGLQLYDAIMRDWSDKGGEVFDFTIGDEAFKMKFGTSATPIFGFHIARSFIGHAIAAALSWKATTGSRETEQ